MTALDSIDKLKLGNRLRIARTAASLTQDQAAKALSMARTTLVAVEHGERAIRPVELVAFAKLYGTSANNLLRDTSVYVDLSVQFRRNLENKCDEIALQDASRLLHRLATRTTEIERILGKPTRMNYPAEQVLSRTNIEQQAEDLSLEIRSHLGLGLSPIQDIVDLIESEMGVRVFLRGIDSKIGGLFAYDQEVGACFLINAKHPRTRRAWTTAHELGHFLTNRSGAEVCYVDGRGKSPGERFADLFAAAFLMPGPAIRKAYNEASADNKISLQEIILLAHRFRVSLEAMFRRLEQLRLLKAGTYDLNKNLIPGRLVREITGYDIDEDKGAPPPRLSILAVEAFGRGLLTEGQMVDFLAIDRVLVRELIDALLSEKIENFGNNHA